MISLTYTCSECNFVSLNLEDAQNHANEERHTLHLSGRLTPNKAIVASVKTLEERQRQKVRDNAIMRLAREKGLL